MAKLIACAGQGVELSGVPTEIKILPLGRVHSQKGDFNVDDESFELIRKQFKDRKLDLVIDYEHQTLSDVQAPAGGWIKDLYKGEDAIIAKVEWTPKAAEYLKNKEYRYLSPVVLVRKRDQKATAIHSVALTNTPAIDGMFALVNSLDIEDISEGGNIMDLKELAKALGLPETATEEEIKKAVEDAVKAARENAKLNGLDNCKFIAGDVLKVLDDLTEKPDVIVLDPPRDGIHPKALPKILSYGVNRIVYVSCKATSLARDLEAFLQAGYRLEKACCVDQFCETVWTEAVALLLKE